MIQSHSLRKNNGSRSPVSYGHDSGKILKLRAFLPCGKSAMCWVPYHTMHESSNKLVENIIEQDFTMTKKCKCIMALFYLYVLLTHE